MISSFSDIKTTSADKAFEIWLRNLAPCRFMLAVLKVVVWCFRLLPRNVFFMITIDVGKERNTCLVF